MTSITRSSGTSMTMIAKGRLRLTVLPQGWNGRPLVRSDCLTAEQHREHLLQEWAERNPDVSLDLAPDFVTKDGSNCARPCPWLSCRHHTLIEVNRENGCITKTLPFDEARSESISAALHAKATCSLDVAEDGEHTLEQVGAQLGVTRQRVETIEHVARQRARAARQRGEAVATWRQLLTRR